MLLFFVLLPLLGIYKSGGIFMKKLFHLFLITALLNQFTLGAFAKQEQTNKEEVPFEVNSITIGDKSITITGWGMLTEQQHFDSTSSHSYTLELVSDKNHQLTFTSKPSYNDQTVIMSVAGIPKCKKNAYFQDSDTCNYNYTYTGFQFTIPFSDLKVDHSYSATLAITANKTKVTKKTPIFYPILTPITKNVDVTQYKIGASMYDTSLKVTQTTVFELKEPKKGVYRNDKVYCTGHGYIRYYRYHTVYKNIYDRVKNGNTTYYKVKTDRYATCLNGYNYVKEGTYYTSYIASHFVDYSGESLHIEVNDINHAPVITVINNPQIEKGQTINLLPYLKATDEEDGDITHLIQQVTPLDNQKIGEQEIVFKVTDSHGKSSETTMVVTVVKGNNPPQIHVENQVVYQYDSFNPKNNATASDEEDGNLTQKMIITGNVDTSQLGTYEVTYQVTDSKGASDSKTILVQVVRNPKEKIRYISKNIDKLFYHEQVPKNWKNKIQFLIEQLEQPKQFASSTFQN